MYPNFEQIYLDNENSLIFKVKFHLNTDLLSWRSLNIDFNVVPHLDFWLTSYNTGLMKPNRKVYQLVCDIAGVS